MRHLALALTLLFASTAHARIVGWAEQFAIRHALDATRAPVARCVEDYRTDIGPRSVRFGVQLRVAPDGSIANVSFHREGPLSMGQRYCVRRTLEEVRLPAPHAEQRLPVTYVVDLR